jgi:large subunit ribosomal protein L22
MIIKAAAKFVRTSPRKLRLVADLIRPMGIDEALATLKQLRQRAATPLLKVLKQAVANAVNNYHLSKDKLALQLIEVNGGPIYKRFQPVAKGRAHPIKKRTSHIKIILKVKEEAKPASAKASARQSGTKS